MIAGRQGAAGILMALALSLPWVAMSTAWAAPPFSPEVMADGRVTFRLRAEKAQLVKLDGSWAKGAVPMVKNEGVWAVTLGPLPAGVHEYHFIVDDLAIIDRSNPIIKPGRLLRRSVLEIPSTPAALTELQDVPHGTVHAHVYHSKVTGTARRLHVYTPPGYEKRPKSRFPVLFLFHGRGDTDAVWPVYGRAPFIADNLIAQGRARPMVIVMPDGHAEAPDLEAQATPDIIADIEKKTPTFARDFLENVVPLVEGAYRLESGASKRAIVGLSMGGHQSLSIGLAHLDRFGWVGGLSPVPPSRDTVLPAIANVGRGRQKMNLLWIGCGKDDFLFDRVQGLVALLSEKKVPHTFQVTEGGHGWPVFRRYLADVLPLLFVSERPRP